MHRDMLAINYDAPGEADVLRAVRLPIPAVGETDVLIAVRAAGINRPDLLQRRGKYPPPPGASPLLGLEVAGVVAAVGGRVARWKAGDAVCALLAGGGYAEYCVAPQEQCLPIPSGLDMIQAASIPETFFTVWTNVFDRGHLQTGETLLVHGGASGIGTAAIQLARAFGARVLATAGTPEKCGACVALGADRAFDYHREDFVSGVQAWTNGRGVDLILDMVGGDYTPRNLACLAQDGRLVQIAVLRGSRTEVDLSVVMRKRVTLTGSTLRPRSAVEKGAIAVALEAAVWPLLANRTIRPVVHRVFPLTAAADAHRALEAGDHIGKIVLDVAAPVVEP